MCRREGDTCSMTNDMLLDPAAQIKSLPSPFLFQQVQAIYCGPKTIYLRLGLKSLPHSHIWVGDMERVLNINHNITKKSSRNATWTVASFLSKMQTGFWEKGLKNHVDRVSLQLWSEGPDSTSSRFFLYVVFLCFPLIEKKSNSITSSIL